ncbi:MAG TPA: VOC family protein, partial [Streptosporangiaceae bacterium]|nr:VOC family protein [Streptosporangiaceae bacterium]
SGLLYMIPSFPGMSHCRQHAGRRGQGQSPGGQDICHLGDTSGGGSYAGGVYLGLIAIVVSEYDPAIRFFVDALGFELVEDSPALTNDGRPKRWVVVRPPGAATGLLLARADGEDQAAVIGTQAADRVGFFLNVEDFGAAYARMQAAGVRFLGPPRSEPYGQVTVFLDLAGNKWDLIGP